MSKAYESDSAASGSGRGGAADPQALIGLLENLVPLLLQFQAHVGPLGLSGAPGAQLEQQAAVAFTEDVILDSIRNLSTYLQRNSSRYPGLDAYVGVVGDAKQALAGRDYQRALARLFDTYRAIAILRAIRPELPQIRPRAADEQQAGTGESVH